MDHDQLIDLTRRALKPARNKTTDLTPRQHLVDARGYTSLERHDRDRAMLLASPQLVGYVSELPGPGSYCAKTVMGRSILLTRTSGGSVKAFDNVPARATNWCSAATSPVCNIAISRGNRRSTRSAEAEILRKSTRSQP